MRLFGTDGIRSKAGVAPLDDATVAGIGAALVRALAGDLAVTGPRVLIGRDTRESGVWIERALGRGLHAEGAAVVSAGIVPTPAVAYLTRAAGFDAGVVISASHNPFDDNGIKIFSRSGEKLHEGLEAAIERLVSENPDVPPSADAAIVSDAGLAARYVTYLREILPTAGPLTGSLVVVDCANGATAPIAPPLFRDLGFDLLTLGDQPDGCNINLGCGSTHMDALRETVVRRGARLGIAFDGDGDRALFVDRHGRAVTGDAVLLIAAEDLRRHGRLRGDGVVATVMSNVGLELALRERGIELIRAAVGDKYVSDEMLRRGLALGGEQSGHIIFADHLSTGDGMATALQVLRIMGETGRELDDLAAALVTYPQVLVNVRVRERVDYMTVPAVAAAIARVESRINDQGRVLIRYSGTEPLLRIMLEGRDQTEIQAWANEIADAVRAEIGAS